MANEFFSDEMVSEVRERANILEVVSDYVSLKKTGRNHKGLCPFHSEKTPSFMVNEEKQIFHCFGCGEGGDVFTFLMKMGHFSFPEAVETLAKRYGVRLSPREISPAKKKEVAKREILFQINQVASDYFHDLLLRRREGEAARNYFAQKRHEQRIPGDVPPGVFSRPLGWPRPAPSGEEASSRDGKRTGASPSQEEGGLVRRFSGEDHLSHLRHPSTGRRIRRKGDQRGAARSISTLRNRSIYHKGETLYGLQVAKQSIAEKDGVIIVEGYFDLLTLHQYGFKNSVATLGTALTPQHIRTLKRYTKNFITLFDGDEAGIHANLRTLPLFLEEEVWPKTVVLPKGEDPDRVLEERKGDELERRVAEAVPLFDFFLESLRRTYDVKSIDGKVKMAEEGLALIRRVPEGIRQEFLCEGIGREGGYSGDPVVRYAPVVSQGSYQRERGTEEICRRRRHFQNPRR